MASRLVVDNENRSLTGRKAKEKQIKTFIYYVIAISVSVVALAYAVSWGVTTWKVKKELTEETEALMAKHQDQQDKADVSRRVRTTSQPTRNLANANPELEQSIKASRSALQINPNSVPMRVKLVKGLMATGQNGEAMQVLRDGVRVSPYAPELRAMLGRTLESEGDMQGALSEYEALAKMDPRTTENLISVARILEALGRNDEALRRYQQAAAGDKAYGSVYEAARKRLSVN